MPELDHDDEYVVGMRVENLPTPYTPSDKVTCSHCGEDMWLSRKTSMPFIVSGRMKPVCVECALSHEPGKADWKVLPETVKEANEVRPH